MSRRYNLPPPLQFGVKLSQLPTLDADSSAPMSPGSADVATASATEAFISACRSRPPRRKACDFRQVRDLSMICICDGHNFTAVRFSCKQAR